MLLKRLIECVETTAIDDTRLRELLNPLHDKGNLRLGYSLAHATVKPKKTTLPHRIKTSSEVYYLLKGRGLMHIDNEIAEAGPGDVIYISPGSVQYIENTGNEDLVFLCIVYPSWRSEDEELVPATAKWHR